MSPGARRRRHVRERAVAVVAVEPVRRRVVPFEGGAGVGLAVDEDVQVGVPVAVVVERGGRGAVLLERDAGLRADLFECAVAAVAVEKIRAKEVGDVEIGAPVVVVVEGQRPGAFSLLARDVRVDRDVLERPVAEIAVQTVAVASRHEEVLPSVAVIVEDGGAGGKVLARDRDVLRGVWEVGAVRAREPGLSGDVLEERLRGGG